MKKFVSIIAALLFLLPSISSAQYFPATQVPFGTGTYFASTSPNFVYSTTTNRLTVTGNINVTSTASTSILCLTSDTCRSTWPTGGLGTVTSVDMTVPTGLTISGNPITTLGTLALSLTSGFNIPLTASTTNWNSFFDTPSTRITDGTGLTWSANILNCDTASGSVQGCLTSTDWNTFNGKQAAGNYITALTGDVTASGPGSSAATLASIISASSCTNCNLTYDAKGRLTVAASGSAGTGTVGTSTNEVSGRVPFWTTNSATPALLGGDPALFWDNTNKNLGVGTTSPWGELSIGTVNQSVTSPTFVIASSSTAVGTTTQFIVRNGNVGISSTTPSAKLSVTNSPGVITTPIFSIATTTAAGVPTDIFQIDGSGNVTMGQSGVYANAIRFNGTTGAAYYGLIGSGNNASDGPYVGIDTFNEDVRFTSGARSFWVASGGSRDTGIAMSTTNVFTSAGAKMLYVKNQSQASSGDAASLYIEPFWNTSGGTANTSDILITRTDTSLCSTCKNDFARFQIGSTDKFRVFNDGGGYYAGKLGMGTTTPNATSYTFGSVGRAPRNCAIGCTISATADAEIRVTNTSAPRTITLPTCDGSTLGNEYGVKDSSGGAATNNITVARAGSDTIDGATSKVISTNYGYFRFYCGIAGAWDIH